jgi:hypothetical protein
MKIDFTSSFLGEAIVWRTESTSRPGMFHYTMRLRLGGFICSCESWQYRGTCKHTEEVPKEVLDKVLAVVSGWRT